MKWKLWKFLSCFAGVALILGLVVGVVSANLVYPPLVNYGEVCSCTCIYECNADESYAECSCECTPPSGCEFVCTWWSCEGDAPGRCSWACGDSRGCSCECEEPEPTPEPTPEPVPTPEPIVTPPVTPEVRGEPAYVSISIHGYVPINGECYEVGLPGIGIMVEGAGFPERQTKGMDGEAHFEFFPGWGDGYHLIRVWDGVQSIPFVPLGAAEPITFRGLELRAGEVLDLGTYVWWAQCLP